MPAAVGGSDGASRTRPLPQKPLLYTVPDVGSRTALICVSRLHSSLEALLSQLHLCRCH